MCDTNSASSPKSAICFSISLLTSGLNNPNLCASRVSTSNTFFSNPRLISSSRGIQMFSDDDMPLNVISYS